ncbi:MAG: HlyC/CorC family transporter [Selenomonadaceae bacterium]|nr:HlyC/CorC family transporter [Selenomonadaceae bacterium]
MSTLILVLACNYFSRMETAINESHRGRIEKLADDGDANAKRSLEILEDSEDFLSTTQIGKTLSGIFAGLVVVMLIPKLESILGNFPHAETIAIIISIIFVGSIMILFGDFLPKQVARQRPEEELLEHHGSLDFMRTIFSPILFILNKVSSLAFLIFGVSENKPDAVTEDEVKDLIDQGTEDGTFEQVEHDMVDRIFHLSDQTVSALMIPRTQMVWLDLEDSLEENLEKIKTHNHTFFPVGRGSLDSFAGILSMKSLIDFMLENGKKNIDLEQLLQKPIFAPRSMETFRLLEKFRDNGSKFAIVLDEYGGVVGEITLGHILEVIIDTPIIEKKKDPASFQQKDSNSWYVEGLCPITEFKERFDIDSLPDEEHDHFQTMGGFLTSYFGYIPKVGELCAWNGFRFEIVRMDRARIDRILVTQLHEENQSDNLHR